MNRKGSGQVENALLRIVTMSGAPIVFKRTKSKPSQRARPVASDLNDELQASSSEVTATEEDSPGAVAKGLKKKLKTRSKPRSGLSFGGDDEVSFRLYSRNVIYRAFGLGWWVVQEGQGEVFQVKKSSLSRKLALGRAAASSG